MNIINLEMAHITFVDLPIQAIMVCKVEEQPEQSSRFLSSSFTGTELEEKKASMCEEIYVCLLLSPLWVPMLCIGIPVVLPILILERKLKNKR
jgi:hypothetical protein